MVVPVVLGFAFLEGAAFAVFGDDGSEVTGATLFAYGISLEAARRWAGSGRTNVAISIVCCGFLLACLIVSLAQPTLITVLILAPLLAVAVVLLLLWQFRSRLVGALMQARSAEERALHDATHDPLTGLPNRTLLMERLGRTLERARLEDGYLFAVLFLDLDRFKNVNDSLGHTTGDRMLVEIAWRLEACVRPTDTVARLGGDEFTVLLEDVESPADALEVAGRLQQTGCDYAQGFYFSKPVDARRAEEMSSSAPH